MPSPSGALCGVRGQAASTLTHTPQCNSSGGDCIHRAYSSGVTAAREWYRFHYVNILALLPPAHKDHHRSLGSHFIFSCLYDGQDCQAR